jgi:hypothetical protein
MHQCTFLECAFRPCRLKKKDGGCQGGFDASADILPFLVCDPVQVFVWRRLVPLFENVCGSTVLSNMAHDIFPCLEERMLGERVMDVWVP